ncbi:MAG TPA: hypothetical protein VMJ72_00175 [Candidatus Paceibacterota bacterium]|nr:hypothetical protein [Candidatus Paceibacterota bacterium]
MAMQRAPIKAVHYDKSVWVNPTTEAMRRSECLCLNCRNMKPGAADHCSIAQKLYAVCMADNVAMIITRCPLWAPKPPEQQR